MIRRQIYDYKKVKCRSIELTNITKDEFKYNIYNFSLKYESENRGIITCYNDNCVFHTLKKYKKGKLFNCLLDQQTLLIDDKYEDNSYSQLGGYLFLMSYLGLILYYSPSL